MNFEITVQLRYLARNPGELLLQIEAAQTDDQKILSEELAIKPNSKVSRVAAEEGIGERIWLRIDDRFECSYSTTVQVDRVTANIYDLNQTPLNFIPCDVVKYLMASRYCHLGCFDSFLAGQFNGLSGGALIACASDWITSNFEYANDVSNSSTTAFESFTARKGVCRDYAHVLIAMARSVAIPARIVSAYAPDVTPQDFHAVVEVYLEGSWHLIDPTGMSKPSDIVRIGVGRDAADVAFMTSYNWMDLETQSVQVTRI